VKRVRRAAGQGRTAAGGPRAPKPGVLFDKLVALQARLRAPGGCPWDREQTHESLRTFLLEEAYEVLDALDRGSPEDFASELGDLLLQIVFHAQLAQEAGEFEISDVIRHIHDKLVRRHPHVFGSVKAGTATEVLKNWEQLKAEERKASGESDDPAKHGARAGESILDGVPRTLPALLEAYQLTRRAANIGFDWEHVEGILEKLNEESAELRGALEAAAEKCGGPAADGDGRAPAKRSSSRKVEEEVGDLLFVAVNVARFLGVDPEIALKKANRKFAGRFQWMERETTNRGTKLAQVSRAEMEELWDRSKNKA
jgi:MazG family protein